MDGIAAIVRRRPRTVDRWVRERYLKAHSDGSRNYRIDLDEVHRSSPR